MDVDHFDEIEIHQMQPSRTPSWTRGSAVSRAPASRGRGRARRRRSLLLPA